VGMWRRRRKASIRSRAKWGSRKKVGASSGNGEESRMSILLQTVEGKITSYPTIEPIFSEKGGKGAPPEKYVAHCGREWKDKPKKHEECDHLDCAIFLAQKQWKEGPLFFLIFIVLDIFFMSLMGDGNALDSAPPESKLMLPGLLILITIWVLIEVFRARKRFKELTEYKDTGRINGIHVFQIFEDQEEAGTKRWWQFWK
jgi:hypothetical protein